MTQFIKNFITALPRRLGGLAGRLAPVRRNKVLVCSYYGKGYGDNPKYIVDALLKTGEKLRIIWLVKAGQQDDQLPDGVERCVMGTFAAAYHQATAKVWIDNSRKYFRFKRKEQFYLQTWHGFALKRIEKDVADQLDDAYVNQAVRDSRATDLIVSDSDFMTGLYRNSFWYDGPVEQWGAPRNDIVVRGDGAVCAKVRAHYGLAPETAMVLYAPTFRADHSVEAYSLDYEKLLAVCREKFGSEFALLVRLHPILADVDTGIRYDGKRIINATPYPDLQELLCAAAVVITDYSSLMFDFTLSGKPCFLFATDIEKYRQDRNFYFDLEALPFAIGTSNEELERNIRAFDPGKYEAALKDFQKKTGMVTGGTASDQCARRILEVIRQNRKDYRTV